MKKVDQWIVLSTLALVGLGLLMVASASMVISDRQFNYPFHYLIRQSLYVLLGLSAAYVVTKIPSNFWKKTSGILFLGSIFLLLVVLIPGVGRMVNGSRRWLNFGVMTLQVSEVAKLCTLLYLASYLARFHEKIKQDAITFIKPIVLLGLLSVLLLLEPDFGSFAVLSITFLVILFMSGVRLKPFLILFVAAAVMMTLLAVLSPYRLERLTTFLNPWHHQYGAGYQLTQSLIAFGRGGVFGVGLGNSVQKLFYLPEAHTDFLFAVLAEELGLVGGVLLLGLFSVLVGRLVYFANKIHQSGELFKAYVLYGIGLWLGLQAVINIGVNTGLLPTKGLTLPLVSYGGSSMLINLVAIAIALRVISETSQLEKK